MTDSEKLDLLLGKMENIEDAIKDLKRQQMRDTAELKAMDSMILDDVERVHEIMLKRTGELEKKIG